MFKVNYKLLILIVSIILIIVGSITNYFGIFIDSILTEIVSAVLVLLISCGVVVIDKKVTLSEIKSDLEDEKLDISNKDILDCESSESSSNEENNEGTSEK